MKTFEEEIYKLQEENRLLREQLQLVGESLRTLTHKQLEINRHANDAYQHHAAWILNYMSEKQKEGDEDERDQMVDLQKGPVLAVSINSVKR